VPNQHKITDLQKHNASNSLSVRQMHTPPQRTVQRWVEQDTQDCCAQQPCCPHVLALGPRYVTITMQQP
jgi:hypothetical protein